MKRKYRRRRRTTKRKGRRQRYRGKGNATEIKYRTAVTQNQANKLSIATADSTDLFAAQNFVANLLDNITLGTSYGQRIGSKIYVMSIQCRFFCWSCPATTTYDAGTFHLRHIWHNQRSNAGTTIANFFNTAVTANFTSSPDRKAINVHYDKVFRVSAFESTTESTGTFTTVGGQKYIQYRIPVNRYVTYTSTGVVKEDFNVYSLAMLTGTPGLGSTTNDLRQIGCHNAVYRIYFKDA